MYKRQGQSRLNAQTSAVIQIVLFEFVDGRRSGSHQAHIANQNIVKLWQLVQAGFPEKSADLRNPGIVLHLEHGAVHFILGHELLFAGLRVDVHGTELVEDVYKRQ